LGCKKKRKKKKESEWGAEKTATALHEVQRRIPQGIGKNARRKSHFKAKTWGGKPSRCSIARKVPYGRRAQASKDSSAEC